MVMFLLGQRLSEAEVNGDIVYNLKNIVVGS